MSRISTHRWLACLLLIAGCPAGMAGAGAEGGSIPANLDVLIGDDGTALLLLNVVAMDDNPPAEAPDFEQALAQALGRPLEDLRSEHVDGQWFVSGRCPGAWPMRRLARTGEIDLAPLLRECRRLGAKSLVMSLAHPPSEFTSCPGATRSAGGSALIMASSYIYVASVEAPEPARLRLTYGYRDADLLRFAPLGVVLLAALGLTLCARRAALRAPEVERFGAWFSHWRFQQTLGPGSRGPAVAAFARRGASGDPRLLAVDGAGRGPADLAGAVRWRGPR
jgi:hypothetical protein